MNVFEILQRAQACLAQLPARTISPQTLQAYRDDFAGMWREKVLDALRPGYAIDTFYRRRAALHVGSLLVIGKFSTQCYVAAERNDIAATRRWSRMLVRALDRIEPALALNPRSPPGSLPCRARLRAGASRSDRTRSAARTAKSMCLNCCRPIGTSASGRRRWRSGVVLRTRANVTCWLLNCSSLFGPRNSCRPPARMAGRRASKSNNGRRAALR